MPARAEIEREVQYSDVTVPFHGKTLELHLAMPNRVASKSIWVLYASGDGGWFGAAIDMFRDLAKAGYRAAGFSSRSYLRLLGSTNLPSNVDDLVRDYSKLMDAGSKALAMPPDTSVILAGWSRGAAFSVLAASEPQIKSLCAGTIAIGLPDKEELKILKHGRRIFIANFHPTKETILFDTYERIPLIAPLPVSLIQSTNDNYLPSDKAQSLFGGESEVKKFCSISSRNHRFSGGREEFVRSLEESLNWIVRLYERNQ